MKNIRKKIFIMFLIIFMLLLLPYSHVMAEDIGTIEARMGPNGANANAASSELNVDTGIGAAINTVIGLIQIAGTGIAVIVVLYQGIKYIMAAPSDKANVKNSAVPIVIGSVLLFAVSTVVGIIANIADKL